MTRWLIALVAVLLAGAAVLQSVSFQVFPTEQVLLTQFGRPVRVVETPGLHFKLPLVQAATHIDRRLRFFEMSGEEVILGDQRRLVVDSFAMLRVTDALQFYQSIGTVEDGLRGRLASVVQSSLRRVLGNHKLLDVLSADRARIMTAIRDQVNEEMKPFGVTVADVRIRRADLPDENTKAVLQRMVSERERIAKQVRAEGQEAATKTRADADRDRTVLLAEARGNADRLRGEGEASASRAFADAAGADPGFFALWRTMQAYRTVFAAGGEDQLVLSPDGDFLKLLQNLPGTAP